MVSVGTVRRGLERASGASEPEVVTGVGGNPGRGSERLRGLVGVVEVGAAAGYVLQAHGGG